MVAGCGAGVVAGCGAGVVVGCGAGVVAGCGSGIAVGEGTGGGAGMGARVEVGTGTETGRLTCCSTPTGRAYELEATGCGLAALGLRPTSDTSRSKSRHQPAPRRMLEAGCCDIDVSLDAY